MAAPKRPDAETIRKIKRTGEVLSKYMDNLGWDFERLAWSTGYTSNFLRATAHASNWTMPSRPALHFVFAVMGADVTSPDIVEILGYAPNRGQGSGKVKDKMRAFYGRPPGYRDTANAIVGDGVICPQLNESPPVTPAGSTRTADAAPIVVDEPSPIVVGVNDALPMARRQEAVDNVIDSLLALVDVGWEDVIGWLEANGTSIGDDRRAAIMRAIWSHGLD